jgi:hypothetical protein
MIRPFSRRSLRCGLFLLLAVLCVTPALASSVTLAWDANSEPDLAGYVVHYGTAPGTYPSSIDVGNRTAWTVSNLTGGHSYYFVVRAYNTSGLTSLPSQEVSTFVPLPPQPPTIATVTPNAGTYLGGTALAITGTNFRAGATVWIGATRAASTVVVNDTTINAVTGGSGPGLFDVRVTNTDGLSAIKPAAFLYVDTRVTVTAVLPGAGSTAGGTAVTVTGTNFVAGSVVRFDGTAASSVMVLSPTSLVAVTPARPVGAVAVSVATPGGATGSLANGFTYVSGAPTVSAVTPGSGPKAGGTAITITGANFGAGAVVTLGGRPASRVAVVSATTITAHTGPAPDGADPASPQVVDVVVTNTAAQSGQLARGFTYLYTPASLTQVQPHSGPTLGGDLVALLGTGFTSGAQVRFGSLEAAEVTVMSGTRIAARVPAHAAGTVPVTVVLPGGASLSLAAGYTFVDEGAATDSDGDGLPDAWEMRYGLNPASAVGDDGASGDPDGDGLTNAEEYAAGTHPRGTDPGYFAEGVNTTFFDTTFSLLNPNEDTAHVQLTFQTMDGVERHHLLRMAPLSRATVRSADVPGLGNTSFSTHLDSDRPVVAERTVAWDRSGYGAHSEGSLPLPGPEWYLAEGATHSGFDLFYLIQNPNRATVPVQVTYLLPSGLPLVKTYQVPPTTRYTIWVDLEDQRLAHTDVSAIVRSLDGQPIIVERAMYKFALGRSFGAGHAGAGVKQPALRWFLAEGATGPYFDLFVLVANPDTRQAQVRATFLLPDGTTVVKDYTVAPMSRFNIWVDEADPRLADTAVSTTVESTNGVPVIVERAMWWPGPGADQWHESHNSAGATDTATRWAVASGEAGGQTNVSTYILIANTSPFPDDAMVTLLFEDGTRRTRTFSLPSNSRFNVSVIHEFPESDGRRFGALVEMLGTAGTKAQVVVERAIYWDSGTVRWGAGTNAVGTPLP